MKVIRARRCLYVGAGALLGLAAGCTPAPETATPESTEVQQSTETQEVADQTRSFRPYELPALTLINGVQFTPDGGTALFTLLQPEYIEHRGGDPSSVIGEVGLFSARVSARVDHEGWSEPTQLPFSGVYHDYEPALSPDGRWLVFNSRRPDAAGVIPDQNDLWIVEHRGGPQASEWMTPRRIDELSSAEGDESYASISQDGTIVFHKRTEVDGTPQSDLWTATLDETGHFGPAQRIDRLSSNLGEGDPQIAPDGSFLMFTRWDDAIGWAETSDIYISFHTRLGWSEPLPFEELNSPGADYAPALSPDGQTVYSRLGGPYLQRPFPPLLAAAMARAGVEG